MARRWTITKHAVDRYVERVGRQGADVRGDLLAAVRQADALQERTDAGDQMWVSRELGVIFVVKTDGDERTVVTCFSAREHEKWTARRQQAVLDAAQLLPPLERPSETNQQLRTKNAFLACEVHRLAGEVARLRKAERARPAELGGPGAPSPAADTANGG